MTEVAATILLVGFVSAFVPAIPVEPYLLGAVAVTGHSAVVAGAAAATGQTIGKTLLFLGARGVLRWQPLHRWIQRRRHLTSLEEPTTGDGPRPGLRHRTARLLAAARLRAAARHRGRQLAAVLRRRLLSVPILFLSAVLGFPPLLIVTFYAAGTRMLTGTFVAVCLTGRSIRFITLAAAPHLLALPAT